MSASSPSPSQRGPSGSPGNTPSDGNPFGPSAGGNTSPRAARTRANSLPSSPLGPTQGFNGGRRERESESPDPNSLFDPMELQKIFEMMLKTADSALPTQDRAWRPLNKKALLLIKAGAEQGLQLIAEARERDPSLLLQVRPQEQEAAQSGPDLKTLATETASMRDEIKALREAVLAARPPAWTGAPPPTLLQRMGSPPATSTRAPPAHPEARIPKVRQRTRVVLNTQALPEDHTAKASTQKTLLDKVSGPVQAVIGKKPLSVDILLSGDIALNLASQDEVEALWKANDSWISSAFPNLDTVPRLRRPDFSPTCSLVLHVFLLAAGTVRSSARN